MSDEVETLSLTKGDAKIPPIVYGETGYTGLVTLGGKVWDDCSHELRWPQAYHTFKEMALDGAVHPSLDFVESKVAEATWKVRVPKGFEQKLAKQKLFIEQVKDDMEQSWTSFIKEASSFNRYGFCANEIVFRFRNKRYGSKYDDGLVGLRKLPIRGQGTIAQWEWKNSGRELDGFWQRVVVPATTEDIISDGGWDAIRIRSQLELTALKYIPRKKFLLFRHNPQNESPSGSSPLAGVWQSWKMKQAYQESEAIGTAQDNNAFKILYLPPEYLTEDRDEDKAKAFAMYQKILENAHQAKQSGFILPLMVDTEGNRMFDFDIKNISGSKSYDVNKIIERYSREIQVGLFADVLSMGGDGGSYSLAESKGSIIDLAVKSRLNEIKDQLNHHLITSLFEQNGWSTEVMPFFDYEVPNQETLDNKGKFYQRTAAVNLLPRTPQVINQVLRDAGIDYQVPDDMPQEELNKLLDPFNEGVKSESGGGMENGMPNSNGKGTGGSGDSSAGNKENT